MLFALRYLLESLAFDKLLDSAASFHHFEVIQRYISRILVADNTKERQLEDNTKHFTYL